MAGMILFRTEPCKFCAERLKKGTRFFPPDSWFHGFLVELSAGGTPALPGKSYQASYQKVEFLFVISIFC
jgi:hypothetical protein